MASIIPVTQEIGVPFTLKSPAGDTVTFNEPFASFYIGAISNITGLDGPEVVESFGMNVEQDGGFNNNSYLGRRPFTLSGEIVPTSASDRATKLSQLKAATLALQESGTLMWTPTAFSPQQVYLKYRLAQPLVISGAWVKTWMFSGIASDPRIYGTVGYVRYLGCNATTEDHNYRFTYASGTEKVVGTLPIFVSTGKTFKIEVWMRVNSTWSGATAPKIEIPGAFGTSKALTTFNLSEKNKWQLMILEVTPGTTGSVELQFNCGAIPTVGNTLDVTMPMLISEEFETFQIGTTESLAVTPIAGWTKSNLLERASNYNMYHVGTYTAPAIAVVYGPITGFHLTNTFGSGSSVVVSGINLLKGETLTIDLDKRTVTKNNGEDLYGSVEFFNTNWWGIASVRAGQKEQYVKLTNVTGAGAGTGMHLNYRDTWY